MTETTEARIPYSELTVLSIQCKQCGAELTINIQDDRQRRLRAEGTAILCGVCQTPFERKLKIALVRFYEWFEDAAASGHSIVFRVPSAHGEHPLHSRPEYQANSGLSSG